MGIFDSPSDKARAAARGRDAAKVTIPKKGPTLYQGNNPSGARLRALRSKAEKGDKAALRALRAHDAVAGRRAAKVAARLEREAKRRGRG
jgi:hypothetical protein